MRIVRILIFLFYGINANLLVVEHCKRIILIVPLNLCSTVLFKFPILIDMTHEPIRYKSLTLKGNWITWMRLQSNHEFLQEITSSLHEWFLRKIKLCLRLQLNWFSASDHRLLLKMKRFMQEMWLHILVLVFYQSNI